MRKTISYNDIPWVEFETAARYTDPYSKNVFLKTRSAFRATGSETLGEMVSKSIDIRSKIKTFVDLQKDRSYLSTNRLCPMPKIVTHPLVTPVG